MGVQQTNIFEFLYETYAMKKIRLYQFFAGIGAQAKALKNLGIEFEDYKIAEWAVPSIKAYNAIHTKDFTDYSKDKTREEMLQIVKNVSLDYNKPITEKQLMSKSDEWIKDIYNNIVATHNLVNIMNVHGKDLEIDTNYTNIIFYSFPCQDLSKAGLRQGLKTSQKDGGTRSGLLWEIERILKELTERERESCVLICENVPDLVEVNFVKDFSKWVCQLESLGFTSYDQILNAKDYCIPQNRKRVFMVSLPGTYSYTFPRKIGLKYNLNDFLERKADEKYYLSQKMLNGMLNTKFHQYQLENRLQDTSTIVDALTTATGNRCPHLIPGDGLMIKNNSKGYEIATDGDGIDISGRMEYHRGTVQKGCSQTINTMGGNDVGVVVDQRNLKQQLCDDLIEQGKVKQGDVVKHSFTKQIMDGKKKAVEKDNEMITLTTRGDTFGVCVYSDIEKELFTEDGNIKRYIGSDQVDEFKEGQMATPTYPNGYGHGPRTHDESIALNTIDRPSVKQNLRIRKLTPKECIRLMGFEDQDCQAMRDIGMTDSQIYHVAGDSIVVTVLMGIFGTLCNIDYEERIKEYAKGLTERK